MLVFGLAALATGCGVGPNKFRGLVHSAPFVRARAAGQGEDLPDSVVVPALIEHLNDQDQVVQMSANEALKRRTGQDFGFVPWADPKERAAAAGRWQAWWQSRQSGLPVQDQTQARAVATSRTR